MFGKPLHRFIYYCSGHYDSYPRPADNKNTEIKLVQASKKKCTYTTRFRRTIEIWLNSWWLPALPRVAGLSDVLLPADEEESQDLAKL
jgi:hypothetical protein